MSKMFYQHSVTRQQQIWPTSSDNFLTCIDKCKIKIFFPLNDEKDQGVQNLILKMCSCLLHTLAWNFNKWHMQFVVNKQYQQTTWFIWGLINFTLLLLIGVIDAQIFCLRYWICLLPTPGLKFVFHGKTPLSKKGRALG